MTASDRHHRELGVSEPGIPNEMDVVVVGSGAAGRVDALVAAVGGFRVLVVEKSEKLGGTSSMSGAAVWLPASHHGRACGGAGQPAGGARLIARRRTRGQLPGSHRADFGSTFRQSALKETGQTLPANRKSAAILVCCEGTNGVARTRIANDGFTDRQLSVGVIGHVLKVCYSLPARFRPNRPPCRGLAHNEAFAFVEPRRSWQSLV